ncbi:MAG: SurA N-terminal domain-containing protein, partial [Candidatus Orphnella occulta]|nr:SurA N-terminal domain-containing protein [Candidatus Orphnella occulta]
MLKSLRNKKLMQVIMWGLVVIFAAWGMGSMATSRKSIAGTIFNKNISAQEYSKSYNAVLNRAKLMYGDKLPKLEKLLDLKNQAWDRLILLAEGKKKRLKATNKE